VSEPDVAPASAGAPATTAGVLLRRAREAADLSIDAVAQQLKLAPRQVKALEDCDFTALPGRTFVRGFIRNYARLLRLDPDATLAALPGAEAALERPSLTPAPRTIGEIPRDELRRNPVARIAIPLALVAIVAVAIAYEWARPDADARKSVTEKRVPAPGLATPAAPAPTGTPLPNPLAAGVAIVVSAPEPPPAVASPAAEGLLVFAFRGLSWVEVRDASGGVLLSMTGAPGAVRSIAGTPPLDIVIGSGADVEVTFRGARVDLTPHLRQNVARLKLQ
jgi:cytoskeleton protein RodZ